MHQSRRAADLFTDLQWFQESWLKRMWQDLLFSFSSWPSWPFLAQWWPPERVTFSESHSPGSFYESIFFLGTKQNESNPFNTFFAWMHLDLSLGVGYASAAQRHLVVWWLRVALFAAEVARGLTRLEKLTPVLLHCCGDRSAGHWITLWI